MMKGLISEIQKSSTHDGPGLRTVIFMKGCNMRCAWCHNPETISSQVELLLSPERCISCGMCENGCYTGAKIKCGTYMSPEQVFEKILEDRHYYGKNGGVTISGGEPLCQKEFVIKLLELCRKEKIHTAIETNLNFETGLVIDVCERTDMVMCDCKLYDEKKHIQFTGVSNKNIIKNIYEIDRLNIPVLVRTPVIKGVNSEIGEIGRIAEYLRDMKNLKGYELLTYHPMGLSKAKSTHVTLMKFEQPSKEIVKDLGILAKNKGLHVFIDNVPVIEEVNGNANI